MSKYIIAIEKGSKSYLWGYQGSQEQAEAVKRILNDIRHLDIIDSYTVKEASINGNNSSTAKGTN